MPYTISQLANKHEKDRLRDNRAVKESEDSVSRVCYRRDRRFVVLPGAGGDGMTGGRGDEGPRETIQNRCGDNICGRSGGGERGDKAFVGDEELHGRKRDD